MNTFTVYPHINIYIATWPDKKQINDLVRGTRLLDVIFKETKCFRAGLAIRLNNTSHDVMWIDYMVYAQDTKGSYSSYLQGMYEIAGVVFENKTEADAFAEAMDKKLMWRILDGSAV